MKLWHILVGVGAVGAGGYVLRHHMMQQAAVKAQVQAQTAKLSVRPAFTTRKTVVTSGPTPMRTTVASQQTRLSQAILTNGATLGMQFGSDAVKAQQAAQKLAEDAATQAVESGAASLIEYRNRVAQMFG